MPVISGHSHSIINKTAKPSNDASLDLVDGLETMENTMIKKNWKKYYDILLNHQTRLKFCSIVAISNAPIEPISTANEPISTAKKTGITQRIVKSSPSQSLLDFYTYNNP